ncbi:EST3 Carboxylesterase, partial [Crocuta crocuta]
PSVLLSGTEVTQPEVDTSLGRVRGRQVGVKGTDRLVNVFLGIPFAEAPVGPGRFSAPRPAQSWDGVRDASTAPAMCLQDLERMDNSRFVLNGKLQHFPLSEDCLILNIYSPAEATAGARRPVMVWIHGGTLVSGAATSQDGSALAAYGDVVVVMIQYRLGLLGFLSTGDEHAPGNWGFLDVVAALHWVQGNISPFGGDFNSVTIFGNSAGASIVSALVSHPRGLATVSPTVPDLPALLLSSDSRLSSTLLPGPVPAGCRAIPQSHSTERSHHHSRNTTAAYTIDGAFFPKSPRELLRERKFHPVPFLLGVNNHEFGWLIPRVSVLWLLCPSRPWSAGLWELSMPEPGLLPQDVPPEVMPTITDEYLGSSFNAEAIRNAFQEIMGDIIIIFPVLNFLRSLRDSGAPVFFYEFQHRPSSFVKIKPDWVRADHGAEIAFVFGAFPEATEEEKQLSLTMMAQWAQFARTGSPNDEQLPPWPPFNQLEQYLEITPTLQVGQKLREARMQFWAEILSANFQQRQQKKKSRKAQ